MARSWITIRCLTQSQLDVLGVSYRHYVQKKGEVVVTFGKTYHQGGSVGPKLAEAVNYAPPNWSVDGYKECKRGKRGCPGYPIPNEYLRLLRPGETQLRQGSQSPEEAHTSNANSDSRSKRTTAKVSNTHPNDDDRDDKDVDAVSSDRQ